MKQAKLSRRKDRELTRKALKSLRQDCKLFIEATGKLPVIEAKQILPAPENTSGRLLVHVFKHAEVFWSEDLVG